MKIILKEKVEPLGNIGDIVEVADGYGRNYLIPKGLAVRADKRNVKMIEYHKRMLEQKKEKLRRQKEDLVTTLNRTTLKIPRKVSEETKIYGSVNVPDILKALKEQHGIEIEKKKVNLEEPIRELGEFFVPVKVESDIEGKLRILVEPEEKNA